MKIHRLQIVFKKTKAALHRLVSLPQGSGSGNGGNHGKPRQMPFHPEYHDQPEDLGSPGVYTKPYEDGVNTLYPSSSHQNRWDLWLFMGVHPTNALYLYF